MASAKAATEPSMEEILASIRQIIADEDKPAEEASNSQADIDSAFDSVDGEDEMSSDDVDALFDAPAEVADDIDFDSVGEDAEDEVLTLTPDQSVAETAQEAQDDLSFDTVETVEEDAFDAVIVEPEPVAAPVPEVQVAQAAPVAPEPAPVTMAMPEPTPTPVPEAVGLLDEAVASSVKASFGALSGDLSIAGSSTLEGLVAEMLRPMMKEWLDQNLPSMVERLVQEEIARLRK